MLSKIKSMSLQGLDGYLVDVQVDISAGIPSFDIVGLPDVTIREARERIKTAIKNSGFYMYSKKILVNLAPATQKKEGSFFDLPIAIGVLCANEIIYKKIENTVFIGELSLDGKINKINGVLPMCVELVKLGVKRVIVPKENAKEASVVKGIEIIAVNSLKETVDYLNGELQIQSENNNEIDVFENNIEALLDFAEVKGQHNIKRAVEVAASGGHNLLMIGSPGSGKTMIAKRIPTILPDLSFEESLEITKIYSISGNLNNNNSIIKTRPFRSPHHTISPVSLVGGGRFPKPGEISLAHFGVLFLDELPEFNRNTLEVLRGPLEDGEITIGRVSQVLTYPSEFMLVASMNPCPCGFYGSEKECRCSPQSIKKYISKLSGPLLDRIDIQVGVSSVKYENLNSNIKEETSKEIKERVNKARQIQMNRYKEYNIYSNSQLTPKLIEKFCKLNNESKEVLEKVFKKLGLSARAYGRILKVARTIADLDASENIEKKHILEAIQYRCLDKKYSNL